MSFREFWLLYMQAHRLPGTRGLHYFATCVGILSAIEAIVVAQPMIFVGGIAFSYAVAISAHLIVEQNQPLIRVNAFLGAIADLKMCWLALNRRVGDEYERYGILHHVDRQTATPQPPLSRSHRYLLVAGSVVGLIWALADLRDLVEPTTDLLLPVIQLAGPIVAFSGALFASLSVSFVAPAYAGAVNPTVRRDDDAWPLGPVGGGAADDWVARDRSLRRACLFFLVVGAMIFLAAEAVEHGMPDLTHQHGIAAAVPLAILFIALIKFPSLLGLLIDGTVPEKRGAGPIGTLRAGPQTRGIRVDRRVRSVDHLEDLITFGHRRAILQATLEAADIRRGERLVDVGCGTGELAIVARQDATIGPVIGIDATPGMIDLARKRAVHAGVAVDFRLATAEALPLPDGSADAITSTFLFHHLPSDLKREALREMWRVLAPGGRLIIADYGWVRSAIGHLAAIPMRFNFHEHVRGQLNGELERIISDERLGDPKVTAVFQGYIRVLALTKPRT